MIGDPIIEEGDLKTLRDHTRGVVSRLQSVLVVTASNCISSGVGESEPVGLGCNAGKTIDDAVTAVSHDLDGPSQSVNSSINVYSVTENNTVMIFQWAAHGGPAMTTDNLRRKMEEQ